MLERLDVRNYVLIDSLEIEFPGGLVIITGQTGAGKSILLGALSLLLGAKADASMIGESSDNCVVEAEFAVAEDDLTVRQLLEENDVDVQDGHLIIRRVINPSGRSRAFVNDSPVSVQVLSSLSSRLVDIHSQHQTLLLSDKNFQISLLDHYAGNAALLDDYREHYRKCSSLRSELSALEERMSRAKMEYEYSQSRFERLDQAALVDGELEELEAEQKQLANAEQIKEELYKAENILSSVLSDEGETTVSGLVRDAARHLDRIVGYIPAASQLSERLEGCRVELEDVLSEVSSLNADTEVSQDRLSEVEERMGMIYSLFQAFSCRSVQELIAERDRLSESLLDLTQGEERKEALQKAISEESALLDAAAERLSASRKGACEEFSRSIQDAIRGMELPSAVFEVRVSPVPMGASGADGVDYLFSSTGRNLTDVSRCASGGEMSRIMLALKAMMARYTHMPTMIFDEIDTGVSGSVADRMGSVICEMGAFMQVFAITHLPQVAAKGEAHYLVSKETVDGRTRSQIKRLSDEQRVLELARMLSGSVLTDAAIANARSLLKG